MNKKTKFKISHWICNVATLSVFPAAMTRDDLIATSAIAIFLISFYFEIHYWDESYE